MAVFKQVNKLVDGVRVVEMVEMAGAELAAQQEATKPKPLTPEQVAEKAEYDEKVEVKADTFVSNFIAMTPAQATSYVDTNVKDLASAKSVIQKLALMVLVLAKSGFKE